MNKTAIFLIGLFLTISSSAQTQQNNNINIGAELDFLPYATGGYFGAVWAGKNNWRVRVLNAGVNMPDIVTAKGFTNRHVNSIAIITDHFFKPGWKGWWIGGGLVYWKSSIQTTAREQTSHFSNVLLNGSAGYTIALYKHLYLSPWAGLSIRTAGDKNVAVDNKSYTLPLINPEASLKIGCYF